MSLADAVRPIELPVPGRLHSSELLPFFAGSVCPLKTAGNQQAAKLSYICRTSGFMNKMGLTRGQAMLPIRVDGLLMSRLPLPRALCE